jgi:hypothetical protein
VDAVYLYELARPRTNAATPTTATRASVTGRETRASRRASRLVAE